MAVKGRLSHLDKTNIRLIRVVVALIFLMYYLISQKV